MSLDKFPPYEQILAALGRFKELEWPKFDNNSDVTKYIGEVSQLFINEFSLLPSIGQPVKARDFSFDLFRVRKLSTFANIDLLCEHSYTPIHLTNKLGRCNFPYHPVFYCSNDAITSLIEVGKDELLGNRFCISVWRVRPSDYEIFVEPYLFGDSHPEGEYMKWRQSLVSEINTPFENKLTEDQKKGLIMYLNFLAETFLNDSEYIKSAFFTHRRLYVNNPIPTEILIYPSVQSERRTLNMCLHPNFVDNMLISKRFYIVEVKNVGSENIQLSFIRFGEPNRSRIKWINFDPESADLQEYIANDFNS